MYTSTGQTAESTNDIPVTREYATEEVGQSGVKNFSGFLDTDEWVGDLKGTPLYQTIEYMRTDAIVSAVEKGYFLPIEQANHHFEYDDKTLVENPHYKSILDFVAKDFSKISMPTFLHNANLFKPYGFMTFEPLYEEQEDRLLHLSALAPRLPKTAWKWHVDKHGYLKTFEQYTYTPGIEGEAGGWTFIKIPAHKLLLITNQKEGGNFVGRSEYRPFYREWKLKDNILKQMVITISRVGGGIPLAIIDQDAPENADSNVGGVYQIEKVLRSLLGGENSYIAAKWLKSLTMFGLDPNALRELRETVQSLDQAIAKSAFQMFISLGTSQTGSYNVGDTFEGLYYMALEGSAAIICDAINEQVTKRYVDYNFGVQEAYPKIKLDIKQDMSAVLKVIGDLKRSGVIEGNTDLENFVMNYYGLPVTTKENALKLVPSTPAEASAVPENKQQKPIGMNEKLSLSDTKPRRKIKSHEKIIDPETMADGLNTIKKSLAMELRHIAEPAMIQMSKELASGKKIYDTKVQWGNRIADMYRKYYKRLLEKGKSDVRSELSKQSRKISLSEPNTKQKLTTEADFQQWTSDQANIESYMLENDASSAVAEYYSAGIAKGLLGEALTHFIVDSITNEKGQRYMTAADDLLGAYSTVREVSAEEFKDMITSKTRAEIFDNHICEHCAEEDGHEYFQDKETGDWFDESGLPEPILPDPDCEGAAYHANACRGFWIYNV